MTAMKDFRRTLARHLSACERELETHGESACCPVVAGGESKPPQGESAKKEGDGYRKNYRKSIGIRSNYSCELGRTRERRLGIHLLLTDVSVHLCCRRRRKFGVFCKGSAFPGGVAAFDWLRLLPTLESETLPMPVRRCCECMVLELGFVHTAERDHHKSRCYSILA